jgi:hypothetical protein
MKKIILISLAILLIASVSPVLAKEGTGQIRIAPALPIKLTSPATFNISVTTGLSYNPHIFLVMTNACHQGLTGNVVVKWSGGTLNIASSDFTSENTNGKKVPPGTTNGAAYTVGSLKSELGVADKIWWAFKPFLSAPLSTTPTEFTITITSTHPKMLVYALGMSKNDEIRSDALSGTACVELFDMKVPNSIPGFVIPELGPLLLALGSFGALALYTVKRKKD